MRKAMMGLLAATAFAAPAAAQDGHWYAGVEAGLLFPRDATVSASYEGDTFDYVDIDYKKGFDGDLLAGYDFGMFRLEGELGYKHAKHDRYEIAFDQLIPELPPILTNASVTPQDVDNGFKIDANGSTRTWSLMVNGLIDLDVSDRFAFYAGPGIGWQSTRIRSEFDDPVLIGQGRIKDSGLAWQLIAGFRYAVSDNLDLGLKYRYFRTGHLKENGFEDEYDVRTRFRSHSLLASLIYNFGTVAPPPPPPPPPPPLVEPAPPATQTCADGSVILATDMCPPPPPPPAPAPMPERG